MSEVKDPKIKLFGKTIGHGSNQEPPSSSDSMIEDGDFNRDVEDQESRESLVGPKQGDAKDENQTNPPTSNEPKDMTDDPNAPSSGDDKTMKNEDDGNDKTLKKPDKIIPCPRCNSMDTKFCYFNNYNVNQPRHFCKNCQRYWTAGGTMRNVPIGAGRRKNKNSVSQFRHLNVADGRVDLTNGIQSIHHPNGTVLTFGTDSPLCESMAAVLNIADNGSRNGFQRPEELDTQASDSSKETTSRSSTTASSSRDEVVGNPNCQPFPQQMPCYGGGPWPYMWSPVQWNSSITPPGFGPPSYPVPFYSTTPQPPYWAWNVPWVISQTPTTPTSSGPNSPTLGKHSRDDCIQKAGDAEEGAAKERNLWVPKTLRIDDPGEAAKSSIWETLGIKNDGGGGALFKAFQTRSKCDEKMNASENSTVLQANPAAFSRSLSFHERT